MTYKTNCHGMVLSMFVGFNHNHYNILLMQALLSDESMESHVWMFKEILKATDKQPAVIITDTDLTVDSAVHQASSYLEVLYHNKAYWAHCFICFKFTGGMISSSHIESVNGCLKRLLYSSNISLYELMNEIHRLLDFQDKKEEYIFWKLSVSCIRSQNKTNFLFKKIDICLEKILMPIILQKQHAKIN
ncbi:917_t:CDS:2 [Cetraspora pellucida]|uniref:917_t:CDS:1 n=1 Tax=Cetraspora pellucida TaxID=1433469 RepID=A0A9N9F9I6_9GLOM|nr:917_t:CDS:2 [Cetraspora pellucida]